MMRFRIMILFLRSSMAPVETGFCISGPRLNWLMFYRFQPFGLGRQMTGNALVEPALDLGGQMNELGGHSLSPLQVPGARTIEPQVTPRSRQRQHGYSASR
jgi:hypothetical protein